MELTREDILTMKPGTNLDGLIETLIMQTRKPAPGFRLNPKHYSSDISAAWEVVEKFHEVTVKRVETMKGHRYWCKIEDDYDSEPIISQGDTAPEAICKAAILTTIKE